jgi:endonuclease YncB( thermonuclease family)
MTKAVEQLRSGLVVGHAGLRSAGTSGPVRKDVPDGDTVAVHAAGDLGVRLLGVDAPEVTAPLPGTARR